jgi:hypothetical protein
MHIDPQRDFTTRAHSWRDAVLLLAAMALTAGCGTTGVVRHGGLGPGFPPDVDEEVLEEGAEAEATYAVARLWTVASGVREVGAHLSFTFWSERGALTLTGYTARSRGGPPGQNVDAVATQHELNTLLRRFAQQHTGTVEVTLERRESRWDVGYAQRESPRPSEAKTLPVRRAGVPVETVVPITQGLGGLLNAVEVPTEGEAHVELAMHLEDGRIEQWEPRHLEVTHRGLREGTRKLSSTVVTETVSVLIPMTQGIGERTVHFRMRLLHSRGAQHASGWVEDARVERPAPPAGTNAEFVAEYRTMHENILRRWREETEEGAEWVARRGTEELATWYVGGVILKGVGWLGLRTLPIVMRALRRSGEAATGWLRTTLSRLPGEKKKAFERLWAKVQLEGKQALSSEERAELRVLMEGIEQLVKTPLDRDQKKKLRAEAREVYKRLHPRFARALDQKGADLPIHHRRGLEHAHLFPDEDINAAGSLFMVPREAHEHINALWTRFRQVRPDATAREVEAMARIIDDRFKPWLNQPSMPSHVPYSLDEATETALEQLQRHFPGWK